MAYSLALSNVRWVQLHGMRALKCTLTASGTDSGDSVTATNVDISSYLSAGKDKDNTATYPTPLFVLFTPSTEWAIAADDCVQLQWDPASDSAANGTVRVEIAHHGGASANAAAAGVWECLMFFEDFRVGVNNGYLTVS